jgi:drug/metabolite transporter (DMT)-like permease
MPGTSRVRLAGAFAAIYLLWGGTYLAIALGLQSIPPLLLIGTRSMLGGAALLALSQLRRLTLRPWKDWQHAAISGALLFVGCHGTLAYAQRYVPSGLSSIFLATIPFWIVLVNVSTGQSEALKRLSALVPGLAGVGLIAWNETWNSYNSLPIGMIVLLLASSLSWALGSVYAQRRAAYIPPHDLAGMQLICGGVALLVLSQSAGEWADFSPRQVSIVSLGGMLYLAFFGSVVGNTAYLWLLDRMSAPVVATYTFVNPVVGLLLGAWILGERITMLSLAGAALVISSVATLLYITGRSQVAITPRYPDSGIRRPAHRPRATNLATRTGSGPAE